MLTRFWHQNFSVGFKIVPCNDLVPVNFKVSVKMIRLAKFVFTCQEIGNV